MPTSPSSLERTPPEVTPSVITTAHHARLVAEAIAFPLRDECTFRRPSSSLQRSAPGTATDAYAAPTLERLRALSPGASLPQLTHLRDATWFPDHGTCTTLARLLTHTAETHLEHRGRRIGLRQDNVTPLPELTERWRWLSLVLPTDLFISALPTADGSLPPAEHVELVTSHLAHTLSSPCAETHLHVGAAIPFGVLWTGLMRHITETTDLRPMRKTLQSERFREVVPSGDADVYLHRLRSAALARLVMAAFLQQRTPARHDAFDDFVQRYIPSLAARLPWPWGAPDAGRLLRGMLRWLRRPVDAAPTAVPRCASLLRMVSGRAPPGQSDPYAALVQRDPLSVSFALPGCHALPETQLHAAAFAYLRGDGADDEGFATLFWQYHRVRNATFALLTQEPGTAGLDWFTTFYNRVSFFRDALPRHAGQEPSLFHALITQSRDLHLAALEARTRPDDTVAAQRDFLRAQARQVFAFQGRDPRTPLPQVGLVLHFIKAASPDRTRGTHRLHADPELGRHRARHAVWFEEQRRRSAAMAGALRDHPELLVLLRGVDVANLELAQPTWVLLPLFDRVRRASVAAAARLARVVPHWRVTPMRATAHAGEDYLRIIEGLRRMHEAVEFGLLRQGDRFGHGLAVGADPDDERGSVIAQPAEDRLDDLLWELDRYGRGELDAPGARVEFVRREVVQLGREVFDGKNVRGPEELLAARRLRHDLGTLERLRYPAVDATRAPSGIAGELLLAYLTSATVFARGRRLVAVRSTDEERAMLVAAQRYVRRELARREITIESNPSSNLLIGDLHALTRHPAMRIQSLRDGQGRDDTVQLSLNTDNPITFASCLGDEFAFVYAAMLQRGVAASEALAWIDRRREDGWRSRFTLDVSSDATVLRALLARG